MTQWIKDISHLSLVHSVRPWLPVRFGTWLHDRHAAWAFGHE